MTELIAALAARFKNHPERHEGLSWESVRSRIEADPRHLKALEQMERTGGEPDVVSLSEDNSAIIFCDCSAESPKERRSLCYDKEAWESRKKFKPKDNAVDVAASMGIHLMTEDQYQKLQEFGPFDTKTSSWLQTPANVREKGGAIFGDHRFGRTFIYHNGAESYYAARGFRGVLTV